MSRPREVPSTPARSAARLARLMTSSTRPGSTRPGGILTSSNTTVTCMPTSPAPSVPNTASSESRRLKLGLAVVTSPCCSNRQPCRWTRRCRCWPSPGSWISPTSAGSKSCTTTWAVCWVSWSYHVCHCRGRRDSVSAWPMLGYGVPRYAVQAGASDIQRPEPWQGRHQGFQHHSC
jgi:hypothetical protein